MGSVKTFYIDKYFKAKASQPSWQEEDSLPVEEALQIRLYQHREKQFSDFSITMRTPGNDRELTAGFLLAEKIIRQAADILSLLQTDANVVAVNLSDKIEVGDILAEKRNFVVSSSCGICGEINASMAKRNATETPTHLPKIVLEKSAIFELPHKSKAQQALFQTTGSMHSSTLFSDVGELVCIREDVGRHNALDKINGYALLNELLPLHRHLLLLSGRVSYELVQKAGASGIRVICALGAPSSLAVETAKDMDISLLGFITEQKFNVYHLSTHVQIV